MTKISGSSIACFRSSRCPRSRVAVIRDTRDDRWTHRGGYASAIGQLAARRIGSQIGFVKSFFTAQAFRVVPGTNRVVFAGNARLGLATGFPREQVDELGEVIPGVEIRSLPQSERFYAGGDTTIRGFALDRARFSARAVTADDTLDVNLLRLAATASSFSTRSCARR